MSPLRGVLGSFWCCRTKLDGAGINVGGDRVGSGETKGPGLRSSRALAENGGIDPIAHPTESASPATEKSENRRCGPIDRPVRRLIAWIGWNEGLLPLRVIAGALGLRSLGHVSNEICGPLVRKTKDVAPSILLAPSILFGATQRVVRWLNMRRAIGTPVAVA